MHCKSIVYDNRAMLVKMQYIKVVQNEHGKACEVRKYGVYSS